MTGNRSHLDGINIIGLKRAGYSSDEINGLNNAVKLIFSNDLLKNGIEQARKFSNSAVQQFTRIGKFAMIGGMTGVEKDVRPLPRSLGRLHQEPLSRL